MYYALLHFKKVVEVGSINRASKLLHISQPALSKSIKSLEQYHQVPLLERHPQGVRPTVYGKTLYNTACRIEQDFLKGLQKIQEEKLLREPEGNSQVIEIGCSTIWMDVLIPEVMRSFDKSSHLQINITQDTSEQLLSDLSDRKKYDIVLCRILEDKAYGDLRFEPLFKSQAAVFADAGHPVCSSGELTPGCLKHQEWIKLKSLPLLLESDLTEEGREVFTQDFFPPSVSFEVEDLMAAVQLLQNNYLILLPLDFAGVLKRYNIRPLRFTRDLTHSYWLGMVYAQSREMPFYINTLMNNIRLYFSG